MSLGRLALAALLINAQICIAQATVTSDEPRDTLHAQTQAPFFTKKDALLGVAFVAGTIAMFPLDRNLAGRLQTHQKRSGIHRERLERGRDHRESRLLLHRRSTLRSRTPREIRPPRRPRLAWHGGGAARGGNDVPDQGPRRPRAPVSFRGNGPRRALLRERVHQTETTLVSVGPFHDGFRRGRRGHE